MGWKHGRPTLPMIDGDFGESLSDGDIAGELAWQWRREHAARVWQAGAGTLLMIAYRMESARWGWHCGRDQGLAEGRVDRTWQAMQAVVAVVSAWHQACVLCEPPSGPSGDLRACEAMQVTCGWLPARAVLP